MSRLLAGVADVGYRATRPLLFRLGRGDAETAHEWTLRRLATVARHRPLRAGVSGTSDAAPTPTTVLGIDFPNPVGLAAGMDKDGRALAAWPALGFGFVEVGTVTWHPQPGNPRPRLYRLPASGALVNRMGFNNAGARVLAERLERTGRLGVPLGISLGKSKITPLGDAVEDYVSSLQVLRQYADYVAVNVSSPNTPGLRALQDKGFLGELTQALVAEAGRVPLLVKIAPDLTDEAINDVLQVCRRNGVAGVIATNTTLSRDGIAPTDRAGAKETGGLSGRPLAVRAREVVAFIHQQTGGDLPIIGVGGIATAPDALALLDAGASLVQVYTGLVYGGPGLVRNITHAVEKRGRVS